MAKKNQIPDHAVVVQTYDELRQLVRAFADGHHELMTIVGTGGVGKSEIVTRAMQETCGATGWLLLKGKHTPLDLYGRLYQSRRKPIVLDDLDCLLLNPNNTAMLKCVCDTRPVKRVEWGSFHRVFTGRDSHLPKGFDSISRVCIVANELETVNANISAVQDRGVLILFRPDAVEVHRELARAGWFDDEEAFQFIGQHLFLMSRPSFRLYLTARNHKKSGVDWRGLVLRMLGIGSDRKLLLVARLLADPRFDELSAPEAARAAAFKAQGGGSRATYHRYKGELLERRGSFAYRDVLSIQLGPVQPDPMYAALYDRRRQLEEMCDDAWNHTTREPSEVADGDAPAGEEADDDVNDDQLTQLRRAMERAIKRENYERAAELRDEIKRLEETEE